MRLLLVLNGISHLWDTLEIKLIFPHIRVQYCSLCGVLFSNIFHVKSLPHPPYQQHHTPPPHTITTLRQTPTPINHTCQPPIITTEAAFQELLALNQSKSSHLHHINILQHHLSNHTTPSQQPHNTSGPKNHHTALDPVVSTTPRGMGHWYQGLYQNLHHHTHFTP